MTALSDLGCLILRYEIRVIHNLTRGKCNIGASLDNTICLNEEGVAPVQCCVTVDDDGSATLTACSYFHETKLDGRVIQKGKTFSLKHGSIILVGNLPIEYHNPNFKETNPNVKVKQIFKWTTPEGKPPALKGQRMDVKPNCSVKKLSQVKKKRHSATVTRWTAMKLPSNTFPSKSNNIYVEKKDNLQADVDHQVENTNLISTTPNIHNIRNAIEASSLYTGNTSFVDCKTDRILNDNNSSSTDINQFSVTGEYDGNSAMQSAHNSASSSFFYKDLSSELIYDPDEEDISRRLLYEAGQGYISDCEEYDEDDYGLVVEDSQSEDEMQISEVANDTICVAESHAQTFDFGHISEELDEVTATTIENTSNTSALIHNQLSDGDELKVSNEKGITSFRNRSKSVEILSETASITNISEIEGLSVYNSVNQSNTDKENKLCTIHRRTKSSKEGTEFIGVNNTSGIKELPFDNFVNYTRSKRKCRNETEIFDFDDVVQTSTPRIYNVSDKMNVSSGQNESNQSLGMKQMYKTLKPIGKQTSRASHVNKSLNTLEMQHLCDTPNFKISIIKTLEGTGSSSNSPKVKKIVNTSHVQKSINDPQVNLQDSIVKHNVSKSNSEGVQEMLKTPFVEKSINNLKVSLQYLTSKHDKPTPKEFVKMPNVTLRSSTVKHNKSTLNVEEGQEMFKISRVEKRSDISNMNHLLNASCAKKSNTPIVSLERLLLKSKESTPKTESVKKTVKIPLIGKTTLNVTLPNLTHEQDEPALNFEGVGEILQIPRVVVSTGNLEIISKYLTPKHNQFASNFKRSKESLKTPHGEKSSDNPNSALESFILESIKSNFNSKGGRVVVEVPPDDTFMNVYDKRLLQTPHDEKPMNDKYPTLESPTLQHDESKSNYEGVKEMFKTPCVERSTKNPSDFLEISAREQNESKSNPKGGRMLVMTPCGDEVFCVSDAKLLSETLCVENPVSRPNNALTSSAFQHDELNSKICKALVKTPHGVKAVYLSGMDALYQTLHTEKFLNNSNATLESFTPGRGVSKSNFEGVREMFKTPHVDKLTNNSNATLESFPIEHDKSDYEGIEEIFKTPLVHKYTANSNTSFETSTLDHIGSKSNLERTCKTVVETSYVDKSKDVSDMQLLFHTPHVKMFTNKENSTFGHDESNYEGIKEVFKTPHDDKFSNDQNGISQSLTVEHDKSNFEGVREMFPTPDVDTYAQTPKATLQGSTLKHNESKSLGGAREMVVKVPPVSKFPDGKDTQLLFQSLHMEKFINDPIVESATFQCDESKSSYEAVKKMFKTPCGDNLTNKPNVTLESFVIKQTPCGDNLTNKPNVTLESFVIKHNKTDSNFVGVREMLKTPLADKSANVSNLHLLFQTPHIEKSTNDDNDHKKSENNDNSIAHDSEEPEDSFTAVFNKKPVKTYRGKSLSPLKVSGKVNQDNQGFATPTKIRSDVIDWVQNVNQQWKNKDMLDTPSSSTLKSKENMLPKSSPRRTKRSWQMNRRYTDAYVKGMNQFILNQSLKRNNEGGSQVEEILKLDNQSDDSKSENTDVPRNIMLQIDEALNQYKEIVCSSLCEDFFDSKSTSDNLAEFLLKQLIKIDELRNQGNKKEKNLEKPILAHDKKRGRKAMDIGVGYEVVSKASVEQVLTDLIDIDEIVNVFERDLKYQECQKSKDLPNENSPGHKLESTRKSDPRNKAKTSTKNDKKKARSNVIKTQAPETTKEILTINSNQLESSPRKARRGQKMEVKVKNADIITKEVVTHLKKEILDVNNTKLAKRHCLVSNELQPSLKRTRFENKEGLKENLEDTVRNIKTSDHKKTVPINSAEKSDKIKSRKRRNVEPNTPEPRLKRAKRGYKKASLKGDMNAESSSTVNLIQKKTSTTLESAEYPNKRQFLPRVTKSGYKELSSEDAKTNIKKHCADKEALTSLELDTSVENLNKQQSVSNKTRRNHKENAESNSKMYSGKKVATSIEANNMAETSSKPQSLLKRDMRNRKELSSEDHLKSKSNSKTRSASIAALTVLEVKTSNKQVLTRRKRRNYIELLLEDGLNSENNREAHFVNKKQSTSSGGKTLNRKQSLRRRKTKCEQPSTNLEVNSFNIQQPLLRSTKRGHKKGVNTESSSKGQSAKREASKRFEANDTKLENLTEPQSHSRRIKGDHKESQSNKDQNAKSNSMSCPGKKATLTSLAAEDASRERITNKEQFSPRKTRRCGKAAATEENSNDQRSVSSLSAEKNKVTTKKVSFAGDTLLLKDVVKSRSRPRRVQSDQPLDNSSGTKRSRVVGKKQSSKDLENLGRVRLLRTRVSLRKIV